MTKFDRIYMTTLLNNLANDIAEDMKANGFEITNKGESIALMHSELSECLEAIKFKYNGHSYIEVAPDTCKCGDSQKQHIKKDEHCPEFDNEIIELVDCIIRVLHYCGYFKLPLGDALFAKIDFNKTREFRHGKAF